MGRQHSLVELRLEEALARAGVRGWAKDIPGVPGNPDLMLPDRVPPVAVFVDGCFWHKCPAHFKMPKARRKWWNVKITRNVIRDRGVGWPCPHCGEPAGLLAEMGWIVVRVWEHDVKENADLAAAAVLAEIRRQRKLWERGCGDSGSCSTGSAH